jgi:hypothetical protein
MLQLSRTFRFSSKAEASSEFEEIDRSALKMDVKYEQTISRIDLSFGTEDIFQSLYKYE